MREALLFIAAGILAGCIATSPYHKVGAWPFDKSGYSTAKISEDTFRVQFRGNSGYSLQESQDFALLRAAELTLENGAQYFVITEKSSEDVVSAYTINRQNQSSYSSGQNSGARYPLTRYTIRLFNDVPKGISGSVYNAAEIKMDVMDRHKMQ